MECRIKRVLAIRTLQAGIMLMLASTANSTGLIDRMHSLVEQAWEDEYIPDSGIPTTPLTDFDNFEVTELFRAVTIEELEAAITDGYPMPWLEETLKDETIPWEDRYWLDRRIRAAIAQNTHTFFTTSGSPVQIDADCIFPGELYWQEHMIVDPAGWNVPEGLNRPAELESWDIGHLLNPYGHRVGEIAVPIPFVALSRDASTAVVASGGNSIMMPRAQPYACFMSSDGSFIEVPLDSIGRYYASISQDGNTVALSCIDRFQLSTIERETQIGPVYIFDSKGNIERTISPPYQLVGNWTPAISSDGNFLCLAARHGNTCLIDCISGTVNVIDNSSIIYNQSTAQYSFSPDCDFLNLGGLTTGRVIELSNGREFIYEDTEPLDDEEQPSTVVCSSNDRICTTLTTERGDRPNFFRELIVYINQKNIYSTRIPASSMTFPSQTDVSPNGYYLFLNSIEASHGHPSTTGTPDVYNLPVMVMQIESR